MSIDAAKLLILSILWYLNAAIVKIFRKDSTAMTYDYSTP